jgi:predicted porin
MKKTLIAAAALMAMAGAAQAQVSLYGLIDLSYGKSLLSDLQERKADFHSGGDNGSSEGNSTSRVGVKGSMDMGGGTKVNFRLETSGIQSDGGLNGSAFGRQMWAGFSGGWGEIRLGRQDSVPFQTMIDFDFNGASNGVSSGAYSGVGAFNRGRQNKSLQYISPNMSGLTAHLGFVPKGNGCDSESDCDHDKPVFSGGVKYAAGPLAVAAVYEGERYKDDKSRFWSVAGSYDFGVAKAMISYANGGDVDNNGTGKGWGIGAVAPIGNVNVGAIFHRNQDLLDGIRSWEVFANTEIFKGTYLYAEYGNWKSKENAIIDETTVDTKATGFAVGVIFTF